MKHAYWIFLLCLLLGWLVYAFILFPSVRDDGKLIVAVIDSGVDYEHEELKGRVIKGLDFIDFDRDPMDENGHGTHVATQILDKTEKTQVLAIRALGKDGKGRGEPLLGVLYALLKGADIINMSYSESYHPYMPFFIWYGQKRDILFVAATGNEGKEAINYPAKYKGVIPIGAIDEKNHALYERSNLDQHVQFVAPGVRMEGADIDNTYSFRTGTSMAAGYASGVLAYLLEIQPDLSNEELLATLANYAPFTDDGRFQELAYERIEALNDQHALYAKIKENVVLTKEDVYALPIETINVENIQGYDEKNERLFSTNVWDETISVPIPKEGYQYIMLRFFQGKTTKEIEFGLVKDTKPPEIHYLNTENNVLSFIVTDTTLKTITVNGKLANAYIRPNRKKDYTYHFAKAMEETYPLVIEIEDKLGHKTTKILYQSPEF